MSEQGIVRSPRAADQSGFALVLAILALMLLTFLGLTMAATTSTELQIATNYRWSQQALYNAEAGLEAAKIILAPKGIVDWSVALPAYRPGPWNYGAGVPPTAVVNSRDYERSGAGCQDRSGVGYGLVLNLGGVVYQNQTTYQGQNLNGAFTVWIRRDALVNGGTGQFSDNPDNTSAIITSEGVAPYNADALANAAVQTFVRTNQAVRILETGITLVTSSKSQRCQTGLAGQEGLAASGENFDPCSPLSASGITGALGLPSARDTGNR